MSFYCYMNRKDPALKMWSIEMVSGSIIRTPIQPPGCRPIIDVPKPLTRWQRFKRGFSRLFRRNRCGNFESYVFPVIKNMSLEIKAADLIDVQPMNVPSSTTFYMDYVNAKPTRWQLFKIDVKIWCLMVKLWFSTKFSKF